MLNTAFVGKSHGYQTGTYGRCELFDGYEIVANPLGEWSEADRERRVYKGQTGVGTTYGSHALYLMRKAEAASYDREYYIGVHHGGGRRVWRVPACSHYLAQTLAALADMPERALYSLLWGIVDALDCTKRHAEEETAREWRVATIDKRVRTSRQPTKGRAFVWIEPAQEEGETKLQHELRKMLAKPSGVR